MSYTSRPKSPEYSIKTLVIKDKPKLTMSQNDIFINKLKSFKQHFEISKAINAEQNNLNSHLSVKEKLQTLLLQPKI